jgi:hypothetical protein
LDVRAEARTYLRGNGKGNRNGKGIGKGNGNGNGNGNDKCKRNGKGQCRDRSVTGCALRSRCRVCGLAGDRRDYAGSASAATLKLLRNPAWRDV